MAQTGMPGALEADAPTSDRGLLQQEKFMNLTRSIFLALAVLIPTSWTMAKAEDAPAADAPAKKEEKAKKAKKEKADKADDKKAE
jgi:hypothetical protein